MANPGRLANPPIKEALVDLRIQRAQVIDPRELEPLWPEIKDRFPHLEVRNKMKAQFQARLGQPPDTRAEDLGFYGLFMQSHDRSSVAQFRIDGFTYSQLANYTTADRLFDEALDLWTRFCRVAHPDAVIRVAMRYVNRLSLRFDPGDEMSRFLTAAIETPAGTPQSVAAFMTRAVLVLEPGSATRAVVVQRLEESSVSVEVPFVLDIDVFRSEQHSIETDGLLHVLQDLRKTKNDLFFSYLTDEALEKYR